jgi:signal recognition particle subunit SRP54
MMSMGGIGGLMGMMPGVAKMKNQIANAGLDDKILKRQVAIIDSMTPQERRNPDLLKNSRKKRIAAGSGTSPEAINKLLKMHRGMADMMKAMGKGGKRGPLAGLGQIMGFGGGGTPSPEQMAEMAKNMPGGQLPPGFPGGGALPPTMPKLPPNMPGLPGLGGKFQGPQGLPGFGKKK